MRPQASFDFLGGSLPEATLGQAGQVGGALVTQ